VGTYTAPRVFASIAGTVIVDQGVIALERTTGLPATLPVDGDSVAFSDTISGCATTGTGATCFGVERGELGRSNGCSAAVATNVLTLP
jgi:hypothetical protein